MVARTIEQMTFRCGELYLFHESNPHCPSSESLWGIFDGIVGKQIYLESATRDQLTYHLWRPLSATFRYVRRATRQELRDYSYNLALWECHHVRCEVMVSGSRI